MAMDFEALRGAMRKLRKQRGMSLAAVAARANMDASWVSHIERGTPDKNPTVGALEAIFAALDARLDYVLVNADADLPDDAEGRAVVRALLQAMPHMTQEQLQTIRSLLKSWGLDAKPGDKRA